VARFTTSRPLEILAEPATELVAECLSLAIGDIRLHRHAPVQASLGLPFVLAELSDREALSSAMPVTDAFRRGAMLYPGNLDFAIFWYTRAGSRVDARMFAPLDNIPEDPATGSAAAALAAFLAQAEGRDITLDIRQGEDMGRPSRISATTGAGGVTISGAAV
jgi:trans-2,3-dihydro-3-hydroxyanthranilate isomerase